MKYHWFWLSAPGLNEWQSSASGSKKPRRAAPGDRRSFPNWTWWWPRPSAQRKVWCCNCHGWVPPTTSTCAKLRHVLWVTRANCWTCHMWRLSLQTCVLMQKTYENIRISYRTCTSYMHCSDFFVGEVVRRFPKSHLPYFKPRLKVCIAFTCVTLRPEIKLSAAGSRSRRSRRIITTNIPSTTKTTASFIIDN